MKALIISDLECRTERFERLLQIVKQFLEEKNYEVECSELDRNDLAFCKGCFGCWIKKPGECVIDDKMTYLNKASINSDVTIFLSPVIFGQFSANIKNVRDRWIPNILPFFEKRPDGSTIHPARYLTYPKQIIIGYGSELSEDDIKLFKAITKNHLRNIEVLVDHGFGSDSTIIDALARIELMKVGAAL
ncbi:MAG: flavodoxin family protein [Dethiobacteria bacterium]|nr:flavodoxin family protein [Dethiobacteria bacterium]